MAKGEMRVMGASGDTKLIWDSEQDAEVENARRTFDDLTKKGYAAFDVGPRGQKGDRVREFSPDAEKLIMVPPVAGG
jgi:hypothetical protein